ncbi:hypothetical protein MMC22_008240, partial [Lobaria immixta]|nr:hypothetical protein [Lobaria immixta]
DSNDESFTTEDHTENHDPSTPEEQSSWEDAPHQAEDYRRQLIIAQEVVATAKSNQAMLDLKCQGAFVLV